jgi:hypothetical protein
MAIMIIGFLMFAVFLGYAGGTVAKHLKVEK